MQQSPDYMWLIKVHAMAGAFDFDQIRFLRVRERNAVEGYMVLDRTLV
jgi:hypothetical protein